MVGVGITPPKVLGTPKPASSVMISNTLGASFGGTTRGAHHGFDCRASSLITPPNSGSGAGSCLLLMVVVALGEPGVPVICWAMACKAASMSTTINVAIICTNDFIFIRLCSFLSRMHRLHPVKCIFGPEVLCEWLESNRSLLCVSKQSLQSLMPSLLQKLNYHHGCSRL
jgi:hypothetical protein